MKLDTFRRVFGRDPRQIPYGRFRPATPKPLDKAALYHYWHPEREGVELAPAHIRAKLAQIHPGLAICRAPAGAPVASSAWCAWFRKPEVTHPLSPGWFLFFVWQERNEEYVEGKGLVTTAKPLSLEDGRLIANIFRFSAFGEFKSAEAHFKNVVATLEAEKATRDARDQQWKDDIRKDFWESQKIKNIGAGNKFARHHDGSIVETRGDRDWRLARGNRDQPGFVTEREKRERERKADRRK